MRELSTVFEVLHQPSTRAIAAGRFAFLLCLILGIIPGCTTPRLLTSPTPVNSFKFVNEQPQGILEVTNDSGFDCEVHLGSDSTLMFNVLTTSPLKLTPQAKGVITIGLTPSATSGHLGVIKLAARWAGYSGQDGKPDHSEEEVDVEWSIPARECWISDANRNNNLYSGKLCEHPMPDQDGGKVHKLKQIVRIRNPNTFPIRLLVNNKNRGCNHSALSCTELGTEWTTIPSSESFDLAPFPETFDLSRCLDKEAQIQVCSEVPTVITGNPPMRWIALEVFAQ
jgi:hypothetical protein